MSRKLEQRRSSIRRLLDSALRRFVSKGYHGTNLEQIAGDAELSKGAVFFYFGSKEAVLLELLKRVEAIAVDDALREALAAGPSSADRLVAFLHHQAKLGVTHRDEVLLLILMSLEFGGHAGAVSRRIAKIYRRLYAFVEKLIREGRAAGELRTDLSVRELASIIMANHDGTFLEWHRRSAALQGPALVRALREVVLTGVKGR
ncbi:MAG TPA: TetR/AcrR family transcriptional regulator [Burkholderiales bacterium]|nr:TetR/AcrR family transcriptional regulator [Burkholderiales bacterium]